MSVISLTAENARPGLRVRCVDATDALPPLMPDAVYTISSLSLASVYLDGLGSEGYYRYSRFVLAEPAARAQSVREYLAANAPGLLDALVRWHASWRFRPVTQNYIALFDAIEAAGLLGKPNPAPLPAMMCGAEAFGEDGE